HVDLQGAVAADPLELALLQDAQYLRLRLRPHVADLVEEECPAVGDLELALARRDRPCEGALLVTEELALDQLARERRAVHLDERLRAPRAVVVERVGDQLLPRAARAADEDRQIRVRHLADHVEHALQAEVGDDEVVARLREPPEGLLAREHGIDLVPARAEQALDGDADRALVVDDQDAASHGVSASGRVTRTVRPAPSPGAATIVP